MTFADPLSPIEAALPPPYNLVAKFAAPLIGAVLAVVFVAAVLGGVFLKGRAQGVAAEKPKTAAAIDRGDVQALNAQGAAASAARVDAYQHLDIAVRDATARATALAGAAPDATVPLAADRAARLAAHDAELCRLRPSLCVAAGDVGTAAGDAGPGRGAVRALSPAGQPDPG